MATNAPILQADGLCFAYPAPPGPALFEQLSLRVPAGVTLLCGAEGSGKTTLLQLLAGQLSASGQIRLKDLRLTDQPEAYRRHIAWLDPRDPALDGHTAREIFAARAAQHPGFDPLALQAHIEGLSLAPHLDKTLLMLSTGSRRKVLLAAVLASQATLTLLDQPFMALDRPSIHYLLELLTQAARQPDRACIVADYEAPADVALASVIELGT